MTAETEIANLLHRYAERMDSGDFEQAARLFTHARLRVGPDDHVDSDGMLSLWRGMVIVYPDGTPRTKHVITNPIIDVDDEAGTATCRSYYTVLQQTDDFPLQVIVTGRYHDRFECVDGRWRFCYRDYSMIDQVGDLSHHLSQRI
jgi:3-phenylpropionate/cinnamic acid dioxygenase small subunit